MHKNDEGGQAHSHILKGTAGLENDSQGSLASHVEYIEALGTKYTKPPHAFFSDWLIVHRLVLIFADFP